MNALKVFHWQGERTVPFDDPYRPSWVNGPVPTDEILAAASVAEVSRLTGLTASQLKKGNCAVLGDQLRHFTVLAAGTETDGLKQTEEARATALAAPGVRLWRIRDSTQPWMPDSSHVTPRLSWKKAGRQTDAVGPDGAHYSILQGESIGVGLYRWHLKINAELVMTANRKGVLENLAHWTADPDRQSQDMFDDRTVALADAARALTGRDAGPRTAPNGLRRGDRVYLDGNENRRWKVLSVSSSDWTRVTVVPVMSVRTERLVSVTNFADDEAAVARRRERLTEGMPLMSANRIMVGDFVRWDGGTGFVRGLRKPDGAVAAIDLMAESREVGFEQLAKIEPSGTRGAGTRDMSSVQVEASSPCQSSTHQDADPT